MPKPDYSAMPASWDDTKMDAYINDPNVSPQDKYAAANAKYGGFGGRGYRSGKGAEVLAKLQQMHPDYQGTLNQQRMTPDEQKDWQTGNTQQSQAQKDAINRQSLTERISNYVRGLQGSPAADDPVMMGLQQQGVDAGQRAYGMSGFGAGGGGQSRLSDVAARQATLPYLQQRQQLASQGMGLLNQRDIGLGQLQQGADSIDLQRRAFQNLLAQQKFAADQQRDASPMSFLGGLFGAGTSIAAGFIPGIGPAGALRAAPGLMQGGAQLFGGFGAGGPDWNSSRYGGGRNSGGQ